MNNATDLKTWIESLPKPLFSSAIAVMKSLIHGQGIHADRDIEKGEILVVDQGVEVDGTKIKEIVEQLNYKNFLCIDWDRYLLDGPVNGGAYINHSCSPKAGLANERTIVAIENISKGEEIFLDYATFVSTKGWNMNCICGSGNCRKVISGEDYNIMEVQDNMGKWFSPYLKKHCGLT